MINQNTHPTTKQNGKFIIALSRALQATHQESEALFRKYHLTMAQFTVLEALYHKGDSTVGALTDAVLSTSGNMTVVIRNLERSNWVFRYENQTDRRSFIVCLTESGHKLIEEVFDLHMKLVEQSLSPITPKEREIVIDILRKLQ